MHTAMPRIPSDNPAMLRDCDVDAETRSPQLQAALMALANAAYDAARAASREDSKLAPDLRRLGGVTAAWAEGRA